jgi:hypothetical protein
MKLVQRISDCLSVLRALPFWACGRAADLQWLQFGERYIQGGAKGQDVGDFALHIQCAWRLRGPSGIIVASRDRYYPKGDRDAADEDFNWDTPGGNRCDERMQSFLSKYCPVRVESISVDEVGGFSLVLEGGFVFEVFPDNSRNGEYWRLFQPGTDSPHIVLKGSRLVGDEAV